MKNLEYFNEYIHLNVLSPAECKPDDHVLLILLFESQFLAGFWQ